MVAVMPDQPRPGPIDRATYLQSRPSDVVVKRAALRGLLELRDQRGQNLHVALVGTGERLHVVLLGNLLRFPVAVEHDPLAIGLIGIERLVLVALGLDAIGAWIL